MARINNNNVQKYIDKGLINPYLVKIDLNVTKTANDNVHRWITLADAIKGGYKFNFNYDINDKPAEAPTLPEVTVTAPKKMYSVGGGETRPFNSARQASEYVQQHPKKDASESALNWLLAGMIAAPAATTIGTAGYIGDRLFHDAVQLYNGEDIDKNGMWVYNPGGWITGYATSKVPQATKALYSFGRTNIGTKGSRLSYVLDKNLGNLEVPKTLDFGGIKRFKWGDVEFNNPNLYYHIDKGNYKGFHQGKIKGGYLKQGYFYPGDSPNTEQIAYSWWNKGNPYTYGNAWKRLIISAEKPQFIHVRSQPYKIGQWDPSSKKSFVTNSEYVASQPVKISPDQVFYFDKYRNGWYRSPASPTIGREWREVAAAIHNKPFIEAYNQWNRFGYPEIPKRLKFDTPKLEAFVKGQLNRHNTFARGVQVLPDEKRALEASLGRKLTDDEFLRIAATTPRSNGEGQAALWISPYTELASIYGNGKTALVRRPFKLGSDRMKWFDEASFDVQHNPAGVGEYTDIMAPWNFKPVIDWNGFPKYSVSTIPESELISPTRMEFLDFVKGSQHMNNRTSLNSNPFFTKGQNHFDKGTGQWVIDTYKQGGKLKNKKD